MKSVPLSLSLLSAAAVIGLSGCVIAPLPAPQWRAPVAVQVAPPMQEVAPPVVVAEPMLPPPPPQVEIIPVAPVVGYIWVGGFWDFFGGHYIWRAGHYAPPRPGYHWEAHQWEHGPDGRWHLSPGHWAGGEAPHGGSPVHSHPMLPPQAGKPVAPHEVWTGERRPAPREERREPHDER